LASLPQVNGKIRFQKSISSDALIKEVGRTQSGASYTTVGDLSTFTPFCSLDVSARAEKPLNQIIAKKL